MTEVDSFQRDSKVQSCASQASPRQLAGSKQERYPAGGIRSKPIAKVESPAYEPYNNTSNLKLKQQSAEIIICPIPATTG